MAKKLKLWFDEELATMLADRFTESYSSFNKKRFIKKVKEGVEPLELKDRIELIGDYIYDEFDREYLKSVIHINNILGPENEEQTGMFTHFYWVMPMAKYVEKYGLDHYDESMKLLKEITKRNTSEFAIRPFLIQYPGACLKQMENWSTHPNFHVRRLSSEGVRPRLPWAPKLQPFIDQPTRLFPILENLKDDKVKYVQKSVANLINDIIKDNLDVAHSLIESWVTMEASKERKWIIKHALRNLIKKEDPWAHKVLNQL